MDQSNGFTGRLVDAIASVRPEGETRRLIWRAFADTLGVAAAAFGEPGVRTCEKVLAGTGPRAWSGQACESLEAAIMLNGIAAHALDYDDLLLGAGHQSAVLVPALLTAAEDGEPERLVDAYAAGLVAAVAVARRIGAALNRRGWHGTGVLGTLAAAAAIGRLKGLDGARLRSALALAGAQSGGLQANFGTMGKPAHAGFAAAAGFRAARLAEAGVDAAPDIFGPKGFPDLYGGEGDPDPAPEFFEPHPERIIVKLYPCCYASHRLIELGLTARQTLGREVVDNPDLRFAIVVPRGTLRALHYDWPTSGMEAKFSARQPVAIALTDGAPGLDHFTDASVARPDLAAVAGRITIAEDDSPPPGDDSTRAPVRLSVTEGGVSRLTLERLAVPGSPDDPPSPEAVRGKIADCFAAFRKARGCDFPPAARARRLPGLAEWLPVPRPSGA